MRKSNFNEIMDKLYKIEVELFKISNQPKYKIGDEVCFIGYGIQKATITDIEVMYFDKPAWYYSFGTAQDWTVEWSVFSINEIQDNIKNV